MTEPRDTSLPELIARIEGWCEHAIGKAIYKPVVREVMLRAERGESVRAKRMRHLEQRIFAQRRTITWLQSKRREQNVRTQAWYEGREALLIQQASRGANREARYREALEAAEARFEAYTARDVRDEFKGAAADALQIIHEALRG